jgi:hypothetical protein
MSRRRGRLQLWDWERFETGMPPGLDRCHYGINAVVRRDGLDHASVMRGLELAGVSNVPGTDDHLVGAAYLATITGRYLRGAETDLGDMISHRSEVMLGALSAWLGLPTGVRRG